MPILRNESYANVQVPFVIKIFVLFIFEWPFYTDFTVLKMYKLSSNVAHSAKNVYINQNSAQ